MVVGAAEGYGLHYVFTFMRCRLFSDVLTAWKVATAPRPELEPRAAFVGDLDFRVPLFLF